MICILCDADEIQSDYVIEFFEMLYTLSELQGTGTFHENQFEHYKFFIHVLFISFMS